MDTRVTKLEGFAQEARDWLVRVETKLDQVATTSAMHELKAEMVKWIVGTAIALGVAGITVMTFLLNNAAPKAVAPASPQPIIINIPAPAAQVPTAPVTPKP